MSIYTSSYEYKSSSEADDIYCQENKQISKHINSKYSNNQNNTFNIKRNMQQCSKINSRIQYDDSSDSSTGDYIVHSRKNKQQNYRQYPKDSDQEQQFLQLESKNHFDNITIQIEDSNEQDIQSYVDDSLEYQETQNCNEYQDQYYDNIYQNNQKKSSAMQYSNYSSPLSKSDSDKEDAEQDKIYSQVDYNHSNILSKKAGYQESRYKQNARKYYEQDKQLIEGKKTPSSTCYSIQNIDTGAKKQKIKQKNLMSSNIEYLNNNNNECFSDESEQSINNHNKGSIPYQEDQNVQQQGLTIKQQQQMMQQFYQLTKDYQNLQNIQLKTDKELQQIKHQLSQQTNNQASDQLAQNSNQLNQQTLAKIISDQNKANEIHKALMDEIGVIIDEKLSIAKEKTQEMYNSFLKQLLRSPPLLICGDFRLENTVDAKKFAQNIIFNWLSGKKFQIETLEQLEATTKACKYTNYSGISINFEVLEFSDLTDEHWKMLFDSMSNVRSHMIHFSKKKKKICAIQTVKQNEVFVTENLTPEWIMQVQTKIQDQLCDVILSTTKNIELIQQFNIRHLNIQLRNEVQESIQLSHPESLEAAGLIYATISNLKECKNINSLCCYQYHGSENIISEYPQLRYFAEYGY